MDKTNGSKEASRCPPFDGDLAVDALCAIGVKWEDAREYSHVLSEVLRMGTCPCSCCSEGVNRLRHNRKDGIDWCSCPDYTESEQCDCHHCQVMLFSDAEPASDTVEVDVADLLALERALREIPQNLLTSEGAAINRLMQAIPMSAFRAVQNARTEP